MPDPIAKLRALLDQATAEPWRPHVGGVLPGAVVDMGGRPFFLADTNAGLPDREDEVNAELIAALRNLAPELLAVVEAFRAASDAHQKAVDTSDLLPVLTALTDGRRALRALDAKLEGVAR